MSLTTSVGGDESEKLVGNHVGGTGAVERDGTEAEHLSLEPCPPVADLLPAGLGAADGLAPVMGEQSGLLSGVIDFEQERPVEEVHELILVPRDAAHEQGTIVSSQELLHPGSAPHPAM